MEHFKNKSPYSYQHLLGLLANQPSKNILELVRRDEVFGMADIATGQGTTLVSAASALLAHS